MTQEDYVFHFSPGHLQELVALQINENPVDATRLFQTAAELGLLHVALNVLFLEIQTASSLVFGTDDLYEYLQEELKAIESIGEENILEVEKALRMSSSLLTLDLIDAKAYTSFLNLVLRFYEERQEQIPANVFDSFFKIVTVIQKITDKADEHYVRTRPLNHEYQRVYHLYEKYKRERQ